MSQIRVLPKAKGPKMIKDFDDAQKKGYFSGGMPTSKMLYAATKHNPTLAIKHGTHGICLYDVYKKKAVVGVGNIPYLPIFQLQNERTGQIISRSWKGIINLLRREGYVIKEKDLR